MPASMDYQDARDSVFRILISTDNHLGVWEKDEIRKNDSFESFEEVFEIARAQNVDLVLLGGDLFHDNKPSRHTVVRAMEILGRHCLGDSPVRFQVVSDQAASFVAGIVNFADPNHNVALPVFTIHGNHDDPAGADNLSAVDILSTCHLVNYFGKARLAQEQISGGGVGRVRVRPVLLCKGGTRLALYGLGALRDERLARLFQTPGCVEWVRPAPDPEGGDAASWFNIFILHQNRVAHTQSAKNTVREGHLPHFLDLVVWGHEHECLADPWESAEVGGAFSVVQPGSSVATALSEGEAKRKHVLLLEIAPGGSSWRTNKLPLSSVRPFAFESVVLASARPPLDPEDPEAITAFLEERVQRMLDRAMRTRDARAPELPLVRLRVDYSGFSTISTQRFGQRFVGRVANPNDVILWQKAPQRKTKEPGGEGGAGRPLPTGWLRPEALNEARIEDLVAQHLAHNLQILPEQELSRALHEFVEKDSRNALQEAVGKALQETQAAAARGAGGGDDVAADAEDAVVGVISKVAEQRKAAQEANLVLERGAGVERAVAAAPAKPAAGRRGAAAAPRAAVADSDDECANDDLGDPGPSTAARGRAAKPPKAPAQPLGHGPTAAQRAQRGTLVLQPSPSPAPSARAHSSRAAAAKAQASIHRQRDAVGSDEDRGSNPGVAESELEEEEVNAHSRRHHGALVISDSDDEVVLVSEHPVRKRGRGATQAAPSQATAGRGAATSQATGLGSFVVSDDEEDRTGGGRRRGAGTQVSHQPQLGLNIVSEVNKAWGVIK